jgi:5-methylcytosine-specific restriction enzyme A
MADESEAKMSAAMTAKPLPGDAPYQKRAAIVLPILVQKAKAKQTVEYGQLASEAGIPNPRNLNYVLGCIGQTLRKLSTSWDMKIPPIQSLVVSKGRGAPSAGIGHFLSNDRDFRNLPRDEQAAVAHRAQKLVFAFKRWGDVLEALELETGPRRYSSDDYKAALESASLRPHHRLLLKAHLAAPERTVTATQLARMLGYESYKAANLHYGQLGELICEQLGWTPLPTQTVFSLVTFEKRKGEWHWIMRQELADALEKLGWGGAESPCLAEELSPSAQYFEGAVRQIRVNAYERSRAARDQCIAHHGFACAVCGLVLVERYGEAARGLIHVHHVRPLSAVSRRYKVDPINDLRPVCPTCHAVIHANQPEYSIDEVRRMIAEVQRLSR